MSTRREIVLGEIDRWQAEGVLDEPTLATLRARYATAEPDGRLDAPMERPAEPSARGFGLRALQLVGGLLLGAACVALVLFLDLGEAAATTLLTGLGLFGVGAGTLILRAQRTELGEALLARGSWPRPSPPSSRQATATSSRSPPWPRPSRPSW